MRRTHYTLIDGNHWSEEYWGPLIARYPEQYPGLENKVIAKVMQMQDCLDVGSPAIEAQDWIHCIKNGEYYTTAALLMTLFPNVKALRISKSRNTSTETPLMHTLKKLILTAATNEPRALGAFSELSEVRLDNSQRRYLGALGDLIALVMILPTMRIIEAHGIHWSAGDSPSRPVTSSVKEILLESSQIEPEHFMVCLERFKTLERFTYNMVQIGQPATQWEPRRIVKALRKYSRRTLVHLELTGDVSYLSDNPAEPFVGTLRSFQVLESVRLMSCMLFKPVDGEDIDENEETSKGSFEPDVDPHSLVEPRRLVDVLPCSARKLMLVGGLSNEEARDMFADLSELKRERMPMLSEIVLEDSDSLEQETKNLCKYAGIRLKSVKRVVHGYQRIYAVTKPAPQVDDLEC